MQARASVENLSYVALAPQVRPSDENLNYLLSCLYPEVRSLIKIKYFIFPQHQCEVDRQMYAVVEMTKDKQVEKDLSKYWRCVVLSNEHVYSREETTKNKHNKQT